jgi:NADPH-dependent curcumin reductase CurA
VSLRSNRSCLRRGPTRDNFRLEEVPMPELPKGGLLLRVLYLSLDPYMRGRMDDRKSYAKPVGLGEVMTGESVCEVIASDQAGYAVGDIVLAHTGWRTHVASAGAALRKLDPAVAPITAGLGVLGMPGFTAYAGLSLIGKPKPGETVVVAAKWTGRFTGRATRQALWRKSCRHRWRPGKMPLCSRRISLRCRCRSSCT